MSFKPVTSHCTNCKAEGPSVDQDGFSTCCNDTVCVTDTHGRCDRCNPLCGICGFDIVGGFDLDARGRQIHPDGRCTEALEKTRTTTKPARKSAERKLAESAGIVKPTTTTRRQGGSHADCTHEATKAARAACRRKHNAG